jgi:hypothetical protein
MLEYCLDIMAGPQGRLEMVKQTVRKISVVQLAM